MYNPNTVLSQFLQILDKNQFDRFVRDHNADKYSKTFSTWNQLVVLITAQMKGWDSLREVETGFETQSRKLYHLGLTELPKRSNLAYANSKRSFEIYHSLFIIHCRFNSLVQYPCLHSCPCKHGKTIIFILPK